MIWRPALLGLLLVSAPATAVDTLRVGGGDGQMADWTEWVESARFLGVAPDSIWTWQTRPNVNLALDAEARGGGISAEVEVFSFFGTELSRRRREGLSAWIDGDAGTAWSPDEDFLLPGNADTVPRRGTFFIDLGATFRVDRIRIFPRLDAEHRRQILGRFRVSTAAGDVGDLGDAPYKTVPGLDYSVFSPNHRPIIEATFVRRDVRFLRLQSDEGEPWEIAEFEVFTEGTVPSGEFVSRPLFVRGGFPIWGRLFYDGGDLDGLSAAVQTRTGPDDEPLHYFLQRGDELEQVTQQEYLTFTPLDYAGAAVVELGPIRPNPAWSPWQAVGDGLVLSPAPRRYLQFRASFPEPGIRIESLYFEYIDQPLAEELVAEIDPLRVEGGVATEFTLSLEVQLLPGRGDTGFRYLQVRTPATIDRVLRVLVDDEEVVFTPTYDADGFRIDIWERIRQSGTFVQVVFTATVLSDGSVFEVRAQDLRPTQDGGLESVYHTARPGDVDPLSLGGELVVRLLRSEAGLVAALVPRTAVFTPNGDGVNDVFEISYDLLKLTRQVPVRFEIYDLSGQRIAGGVSAAQHGHFVRIWTGRDTSGQPAAPGLYIYRVSVRADAGSVSRSGLVHLVR